VHKILEQEALAASLEWVARHKRGRRRGEGKVKKCETRIKSKITSEHNGTKKGIYSEMPRRELTNPLLPERRTDYTLGSKIHKPSAQRNLTDQLRRRTAARQRIGGNDKRQSHMGLQGRGQGRPVRWTLKRFGRVKTGRPPESGGVGKAPRQDHITTKRMRGKSSRINGVSTAVKNECQKRAEKQKWDVQR